MVPGAKNLAIVIQPEILLYSKTNGKSNYESQETNEL
jgi:hypothetical protein